MSRRTPHSRRKVWPIGENGTVNKIGFLPPNDHDRPSMLAAVEGPLHTRQLTMGGKALEDGKDSSATSTIISLNRQNRELLLGAQEARLKAERTEEVYLCALCTRRFVNILTYSEAAGAEG